MFNDVKVFLTNDMSKRGYVTFYFENVRYREYNGKKIGVDLSPNNYKTYSERSKYFNRLAFEFTKILEKGWNPTINKTETKTKIISLEFALNSILQEKLKSDLSDTYKRDLSRAYTQFKNFMPASQMEGCVSDVSTVHVESFLNQFNSTATYYMNKRRALNVFFSELLRTKKIETNPVQNSLRRKQKSKLHKIYSKEQLGQVLEFLKLNYPNLHLACLLAYGCFLRPHQEVRLLTFKHINEDLTKITLAGGENKSKRVRNVNIPTYVADIIKKRLNNCTNGEYNILSGNSQAFNVSYLNTQWSRAKLKMLKIGIIQKDQTIYSFRHTAVVNVYRKTKDLHILQQLLQHSNMIVTLNYLRGLGELSDDRLREVMPEL